jgi:integrase
MVGALTGMRRGEVLGLRWTDLDLDAGKARISRALILVDYVPTISEPKTERGRRTIALDPATVAALRAHQAGQAVEAAIAGDAWANTDGHVFTDELGRVIHPQSFTDRFKRYAKAGEAAGDPPPRCRRGGRGDPGVLRPIGTAPIRCQPRA